MKSLVIFYSFLVCVISFSCKMQKQLLIEDIKGMTTPAVDYRFIRLSYENFPSTYIKDFSESDRINYTETFKDISGEKEGLIKYGVKEGLWKHILGDDKLHLEEYFSRGLRDSVFRIYNHDSNHIIYETTFIKGTGLLKDFHSNGQLYYEIETKDGYFTDTLRLYDKDGVIIEKLFYDKDSLIYHEKINKDGNVTIVKK